MGLRASEVLVATSLSLGYFGAHASVAGAAEVNAVGEATEQCIDIIGEALSATEEPQDCSLDDSLHELSHNPRPMVEPLIIGTVSVGLAVSIAGSTRQARNRVKGFRFAPSAIRRRV